MKENKRRAFRLEECQRLYQMLEWKKGFREIGKELQRNHGTLSKFIKRNSHPFPGVWRKLSFLEKAKYAFDKQQDRKSRVFQKRGSKKDKVVWDYVYTKLTKCEWTPEQISERIKREHPGKSISAQSIYNMIKRRGNEHLKQHLYEKGKKRRSDVVGRRSRFKQGAPEKINISQRSDAANQRLELGHLEIDSVLSCRSGTGAIVNIIDRQNRYCYPVFSEDLKSDTVRQAIIRQLQKLPPDLRRSITVDNGSEFADLFALKKIFPGIEIFWCDPYRPQQRGTVERSNRNIRRFYPKGTDFSKISEDDLTVTFDKINNTPLKLHDFKTPMELIAEFKLAA
jgi:IS30 family transposase